MFSSTIPQGEDVCCWKRWKRVASPSHIFFLLSTPIASIPYHRIQTCVLSDKTGRLPMWGTRYLCVCLCKVFSLCMSHPNWGGLCTAADRSPAALACLKWWTQDEINRSTVGQRSFHCLCIWPCSVFLTSVYLPVAHMGLCNIIHVTICVYRNYTSRWKYWKMFQNLYHSWYFFFPALHSNILIIIL